MSDAARLARLALLAGMVRDARLAQLRAATAGVAEAERALSDIPPPGALEEDPGAAMLAAARSRWQDAARSRANTRIAAATVAAIEARAEAGTALARAEALHQLARRHPRRPGR